VLQTIVASVPVRLMKRDLLFMAENLLPLLDDARLAMVARNRGIRPNESQSVNKLLTAFIRKADEGELNRLTIEIVILLAARSQSDGGKVLKAAAQAYNVNADAIGLKMKQEFTAREKAKQPQKVEAKPAVKAKKAA
jgi:ParB family chromosome partitioning protein